MRAMSSRSEWLETHAAGGTPAVCTSRTSVAGSLGIVDGAGFADHCHLDLARIFELAFDAARDVLRQPHGFLVRDVLALDHDPDLAAGLQRKGFRHPLERIGDA